MLSILGKVLIVWFTLAVEFKSYAKYTKHSGDKCSVISTVVGYRKKLI